MLTGAVTWYSTTGEPTAETETDRDLPAFAKAAGLALVQSMRKTARQEAQTSH
jgi:hypothetical protein